jgi:GAF domain-containing protein
MAKRSKTLRAGKGRRKPKEGRAGWPGNENDNARLKRELSQARAQLTASTEVLQIINSSSDALEPVFQAVLEKAMKLCEAAFGFLTIYDGKQFKPVAQCGVPNALAAYFARGMDQPRPGEAHARLLEGEDIVHNLDQKREKVYLQGSPLRRAIVDLGGVRSALVVALRKDGVFLGALTIYRKEVRAFSRRQIALLQNFAAQAAIAIANARLFEELQARTTDLSDALERQTATAEILKVIASSPSDIQPVFEAIVANARRLLGGFSAAVFRFTDGTAYLKAITPTTPTADAIMNSSFPRPIADFQSFALASEGKTVQTPDTEELSDDIREIARARGFRSMLIAPLLREGTPIGLISVTRVEPGPFSAHFVQLLQTFADQAVIAIENTRLFNETKEALEQQKASSDILRVISSSVADAHPVFDKILDSCKYLFGSDETAVLLLDNENTITLGGYVGKQYDAVAASFPAPLEKSPAGRAIREKRVAHYTDVANDPHLTRTVRRVARLAGYDSMAYAPMLSNGVGIGAIGASRSKGSFSDKELTLLQTFADQAVIAIENARLFNETKEALERQTATAAVLNVIGRSPTDAAPVFDMIGERAEKLCDAEISVVSVLDGDLIRLAGIRGISRKGVELFRGQFPLRLDRQTVTSRTISSGTIIHIGDVFDDTTYDNKALAAQTGYRSCLGVPMHNKGQVVGAIFVARTQPGPFSKNQIQLLQIFADQAVIAIGNVRFFEEVQAKTRDLEEALTYQTGSANILKVIAASPTDVGPVLSAIVESACSLCDANDAIVFLKDGDDLVYKAHHGPLPVVFGDRRPIARNYVAGRSVVDKVPIHIMDVFSEEGAELPEARELSRIHGIRSILCVPLVRESESIGTILLRRNEVQPFTDKQIELLQTFANQAVIAIGNVRLFDEVQARTHELTESLEQQTATAEVLSVISRSAGDLAPVFDTMLNKAMQLCQANFGVLSTFDGSQFHTVATYGLPEAYDKFRRSRPVQPGPGTSLARLLQGEPHVELRHLADSKTYLEGDPDRRALVDLGGAHSLLSVPLLKEERLAGSVLVFRQEDSAFSEKQIALLKQFAAQAVIAIENARLLNELRQRTDDLSESLQQQTATADVLQIISSSPGDLASVFEKMLVNATRVCGAEFGSLLLTENGTIRVGAQHNVPAEFAAARGNRLLAPHPESPLATSIRTKRVVHEIDLRTTKPYLERHPGMLELVELGGVRTIAIVPMLRDDEVIGAISMYRKEVQLFSDKQIELLSNFAKQAVIAIENARLLSELRQRTDDLSKSLDDLRTAQDRLVQTEKLASLGQLTAGIAHEIKNPLNFVNNFSALSAELVDEMTDVFENPALDEASRRKELDDIRELLKGNLEKVVQHGKRADSIVKNMLLHSRESSTERQPAEVNRLVEESLNLAYHGARAEKPGFNISLKHDLDPEVGALDVYPQEMTRALLNLISNGFYAATRRKAEADGDFEPVLSAVTKNLGDTIEIRIRDNGGGISPEVRERMFNPFFTTKPTGEGTGLGLSMTHDIIVKQHGGKIDVETEQGAFTEFIVSLPRGNGTTR